MKYFFNAVISLMLTLVIVVYMPLMTYFRNVNEFYFVARQLLQSLWPLVLILFGLVFLIFTAAQKFMKSSEFLYKGFKIHVTPLHITILMLIACIWLEGSIFNHGLPQITGEANLYISQKRLLIDTFVWFCLLTAGLLFWRKLAGRAIFICLALSFLFFISLGEAYFKKEPKYTTQTTRHDVITNLAFSPKGNIIIIVADAVSTEAATSIIQKDAQIKDELKGFTLFSNNLGPGDVTIWAIPAILQGSINDNGAPYNIFAERVFNSSTSLIQQFTSSGYNVYVSSLLPRFNIFYDDNYNLAFANQIRSDIPFKLSLPSATKLFFSFIPYIFKEKISCYLARYFVPGSEDVYGGIADEVIYKNYFSIAMNKLDSSRPALNFHHLAGVHSPFITKDEFGNDIPNFYELKVHEAFLLFTNFLKELKSHDLYDDSIIMLIADHGLWNNFDYPLVMFKPRQAQNSFIISDVQFSSAYIVKLLAILDKRPEYLDNFLSELPEERKIFRSRNLLHVIRQHGGLSEVSSEIIEIDHEPPTDILPNKRYYFGAQEYVNRDYIVPLALKNIQNRSGSLITFGGTDNYELGLKLKTLNRHIDLKLEMGIEYHTVDSRKKQVPITINDLVSKTVIFSADDLAADLRLSSNEIVLNNVSLNMNGEIILRISGPNMFHLKSMEFTE